MFNFFDNHPISPALVQTVIWYSFLLAWFLVLNAFADAIRTPAATWMAVGRAKWRWVVAGGVAGLLEFGGMIYDGWNGVHIGRWFILPAFAVGVMWALRVFPQIRQARPTEENRRGILFPAATKLSDKILRSALAAFALVGFLNVATSVQNWSFGEPTSLVVGPHNQTIHPRQYITDSCPGAVRKTLHMQGEILRRNADDYERWSVDPMPGHASEALLDTDSGRVVCP